METAAVDAADAPGSDAIREIEDIIDIQKAKGTLHARQVAFSLPTGGCSLESGLARRRRVRKRGKRLRPPPDADSWPSDSDVTVLRMRVCLGGARGRPGDKAGDGPHRADPSSMVNLATTLLLQPQAASKHSLPAEEFLLPLSSWEHPRAALSARAPRPPSPPASAPSPLPGHASRTSRLARFLRLYFCPCCTCLYEIEKMRSERSVYFTKSRSPLPATRARDQQL